MPVYTESYKHPAHAAMSRQHLQRIRQDAAVARDTAVQPWDLFKATAAHDTLSSAYITRLTMSPVTTALDKILGTHGNPYVQLHRGPTWAGADDDHGDVDNHHSATGGLDFVLMALASVQPLNYPAVLASQALCLAGASVKGVGTSVGAAIGAPIGVLHGGVSAYQRRGALILGEALLGWSSGIVENDSAKADTQRGIAARRLGIKPNDLEAQRFLVKRDFTALDNAAIMGAVNSAPSRVDMVEALRLVNLEGMPANSMLAVVQQMAKMKGDEVLTFARIVVPFNVQDHQDRLAMYHAILDTPVAGRQGHANRLNGGVEFLDGDAMELQLQNHHENVMEPRRRVRVAKAIDYLQDLGLKRISNDQVLSRISKAINDRRSFPGMFDERILVHERTNEHGERVVTGTETVLRRDNVARLLNGSQLTDDYTGPLSINEQYAYRRIPRVSLANPDRQIGLLELAGLVLSAIDSYNSPRGPKYTKGDQHAMMKAFLFWMSEMIEDDGHRVCGVGISQRMPMCLQSYYPIHIDVVEPEQMSTEMCREWAAEWGDKQEGPTQAEVNAFSLRCIAHAHDAYDSFAPELVEAFRAAFLGYIKAEYSVQMRDMADAATSPEAIAQYRREHEDVLRGVKAAATGQSMGPPVRRPSMPVEASSSAA